MKKVLLSLACVSAMAASAQVTQMKDNVALESKYSKPMVLKDAVLSDTKKTNAPQRMASDGVYYKIPAGSMWEFLDESAYSYGVPNLVIAPWTECKYQNMSTDKTGSWTYPNGTDLSKYADADNNLVMQYAPIDKGYYNYAPIYTVNGNGYVPTCTNSKGVLNNMGINTEGLGCKSFHTNDLDVVKTYSGGVLEIGPNPDDANLFGAGTYTNKNGETCIAFGIDMTYPKPMSPLYVESYYIQGLSFDTDSEDPLNGNTLTMKIYNLEDENAEPVVLTCTPEQCVKGIAAAQWAKFYNVTFTRKVKDEISGEIVAEPFVIDYPSEIIITGFDQEGVTLGFYGYTVAEEFLSDNELENKTLPLLYNTVTDKVTSINYKSPTVLAAGFNSMFDICSVETEIESTTGATYEANGIQVSADGQTFVNNIYTDVNGVIVYTALDWTDETTGEEMYWSDDMYDEKNLWIQNLVVEKALEDLNGYYFVGAVCDPLPAGLDKRYAVIHLNGRGVTSEDIYVLQGNITLEEAKADYAATAISEISNNAVKASNKKYNLAGQQVDNSFKGIVISNGKKAIKK